MLRSIGADHAIDYLKKDFSRSGQRCDLILDVVAQRSVFEYGRLLNRGGRCVIVGGSGISVFQAVVLGSWIWPAAGKKIVLLLHRPNTIDLRLMSEYFEAGDVTPIIDRCYPLAEVAEAFRYFGTGRAVGKVVIHVS